VSYRAAKVASIVRAGALKQCDRDGQVYFGSFMTSRRLADGRTLYLCLGCAGEFDRARLIDRAVRAIIGPGARLIIAGMLTLGDELWSSQVIASIRAEFQRLADAA
jgi:hypothetical protein